MYIIPHEFGTQEYFDAVHAYDGTKTVHIRGCVYKGWAIEPTLRYAFSSETFKVTLAKCKEILAELRLVDDRIDSVQINMPNVSACYYSPIDKMQIRRNGTLVFEYLRGVVCTDPDALAH